MWVTFYAELEYQIWSKSVYGRRSWQEAVAPGCFKGERILTRRRVSYKLSFGPRLFRGFTLDPTNFDIAWHVMTVNWPNKFPHLFCHPDASSCFSRSWPNAVVNFSLLQPTWWSSVAAKCSLPPRFRACYLIQQRIPAVHVEGYVNKCCLLDATLCGLAEIFRRFYNEDWGDGIILSIYLEVNHARNATCACTRFRGDWLVATSHPESISTVHWLATHSSKWLMFSFGVC
jgi:hypothetical protein